MDRIMGSALEWSTHVREMMSSAENRIGIMPWEQVRLHMSLPLSDSNHTRFLLSSIYLQT